MGISLFPFRLRHAFPLARLKREIESTASHLVISKNERNESGFHILARLALSRRTMNTLIAADGDALIGYVSLVFPRFRKLKGNAYLTIALKEAYRGKGIGTLLMRSAEDFARARGIRRIELDVLAKNTGAIHLYERLGYAIEGRRRQAIKDEDGFDDMLIMAKFV